VGHSNEGFYFESFIDECAHSVQQDPLQFRKKLLKNNPRHKKMGEMLAKLPQMV